MDLNGVKKFLESNQEEIAGWFFGLDQRIFYELFVMQQQMRISGDLVEVGVYQGKSLVLLSLLKHLEEKLFGFDLFNGDDERITRENIRLFGRTEELTLVKGLTSDLTLESLKELLPAPLRWLHIDAGHEYFEVYEQLTLFSPFLRDTGIIAMDDYQDREFPGIEAAVLDFAEIDRPRRFIPFLSGGNKIFMCSPSMASAFQKHLIHQPIFKDTCRMTRVRDFNILIARSKLPVESKNIDAQLQAQAFPRPFENVSALNEKSKNYSQISFGSGATKL